MKRNLANIIAGTLLFLAVGHTEDEDAVRWKRREEPEKKQELELLHSTLALNLPTAETLRRKDLEFVLGHRFLPAVDSGAQTLYGLDGGARIRLGLNAGLSDHLTAGIGRTNMDDNLELDLKHKLLQRDGATLPALLAWRLGGAWNGQVAGRPKGDARNYQGFGQLIWDGLYRKKLGIGIVPSFLENSDPYSRQREHVFTAGGYLQYYFTPRFAGLTEWNGRLTGSRSLSESLSFGLELNTGGHFFKLHYSNNTRLAASQTIAGADSPISGGDWHLGFTITRLLQLSKPGGK